MREVSLVRLYGLRAIYLLIGAGLAATVWPGLLHGSRHWELMEGVVQCMLAAFSLLCLLGLRYPLQLLPVLLWETAWKTLWLLLVPFPHWRTGHVDPALMPNVFATGMVVLVYLAVPWGYVWKHYVRAAADRWR